MADASPSIPAEFTIVADDGSSRWTVRYDADGRDAAIAAIRAAEADGLVPAAVATAMRRNVAWSSLSGVALETKPVDIGGVRVAVRRSQPALPQTP